MVDRVSIDAGREPQRDLAVMTTDAKAATPFAGARSVSILPTVTVIIINFNYAQYLREAVDSVFAQTYPKVQCIIVDNASTDHSNDVIAACKSEYPSLSVLRLDQNEGQSSACMKGLAKSRAPYIVFLDADDYLLPNCVETHLHVHLSSRVHVAFTSGGVLQVKNGEVVVSNNAETAAYVRKSATSTVDLLRPSKEALGEIWGSFDSDLRTSCHLIPREVGTWIWSPTSGNCFRRDALDLISDNEDLARLRSQTDLYLAMGLNGLNGSIVIDRPVFAYRYHGSNVFSCRPQLYGLLSHDPERSDENSRLAKVLLIDHFLVNIDRFVKESWQVVDFFALMRRLDVSDEKARYRWARRSYLAQSVIGHASVVSACVGRRRTLVLLLKLGVPFHRSLRSTWTRRPDPPVKSKVAPLRALKPVADRAEGGDGLGHRMVPKR